MYDEAKSPDEEPKDVAPSADASAAGTADIKPAEATPPAVAAESGDDAIRIPDDHNPAGLREVGEESGKSTLESWMEAANAAEKRKVVSTGQRNWYILKVQSNREDSIRDVLQRKIRIEGLTDFFGDIIVPIEKVTEFKNGKKCVVKGSLSGLHRRQHGVERRHLVLGPRHRRHRRFHGFRRQAESDVGGRREENRAEAGRATRGAAEVHLQAQEG